jgi:hypothetical protein
MKGALLELAARSEQDLNIIGNPQMTYFKSVHKRHTNFARFESREIFQSGYDFGKRCVVKLDKKGDLLYRTMLLVKLPATGNPNVSWINGIGNFMIKEAVIKMGGEVISRLTGDYIDIYHRYSLEIGHYSNYSSMVGRVSGYNVNSQSGEISLFIPLPFWFCRELAQTLPMISLGYSDVVLEVEFRPLTECLYSGGLRSGLGGLVNLPALKMLDCSVLTEYIYLDSKERTVFATKPDINYLIEQMFDLDITVETGAKHKNYSLPFNHPVKELLWFYRSNYHEDRNSWEKYTVPVGVDELPPLDTGNLLFNGNDRVSLINADYFRLVQPLYHHLGSGSGFVYFYCFAEDADALQPSGTANFSFIDEASLGLDYKPYILDGRLTIMSINYNFLRIKKGMAGILYSS